MSGEADVRTPALVAGCEWWKIESADGGAVGFYTSEEDARSTLQRVGNNGSTWHFWHLVGALGPDSARPLADNERAHAYLAAKREVAA